MAQAATIERGATNNNVPVAAVTDENAGAVVVTVDGGASSTVNGITVSNIQNANGAITTTIQATCAASSSATFTLSAADGVNPPVTVTDGAGNIRTTTTNPSGFYRFTEIEVGQTLVLTAQAKGYFFTQPTQIASLNDEMLDINFTAQ